MTIGFLPAAALAFGAWLAIYHVLKIVLRWIGFTLVDDEA